MFDDGVPTPDPAQTIRMEAALRPNAGGLLVAQDLDPTAARAGRFSIGRPLVNPLPRVVRPLAALLYLDLDGFTVINDKLGHGVDDTAFRQSGKNRQRSIDTVCRRYRARHRSGRMFVCCGDGRRVLHCQVLHQFCESVL